MAMALIANCQFTRGHPTVMVQLTVINGLTTPITVTELLYILYIIYIIYIVYILYIYIS